MGPHSTHGRGGPEEVETRSQKPVTWILVTSITLFAVWPGDPLVPSPSLSVSVETSQRGVGLMTFWDWNC